MREEGKEGKKGRREEGKMGKQGREFWGVSSFQNNYSRNAPISYVLVIYCYITNSPQISGFKQ